MKRSGMILAVLLLTTAARAADLTWEHDYDKALASAKESKKIVMVDLYTDWCGWCKRLDRDVFANPDIQVKLAKNFVPLKINPEKSQKGSELAGKFKLRGYPYIAFIDADGNKISVIEGYLPAADFGNALDGVVKKSGK
jgi:thiol:disulfide interchange protein